MTHRIALSHASSVAAEAILEKLPESGIASDSLVLLDHQTNLGKRIAYGGSHLALLDQQQHDLSACSLLLMPQAEPELESSALQQGCLLVSHSIMDERAPVFVGVGDMPSIAYSETRLRLAGPELSCLLPALIELDQLAGITQLHVTLMRSAEFRGKAGIDELASQTVNLLSSRDIEPAVYSQQIAFNLLPEATSPQVEADFRHFLGNSSCSIALQTVNVPVFHGFAAAVQIGFNVDVPLKDCERRLSALDQVTIKNTDSSPIADCNQSFGCVISQLKKTSNEPSNLQFWMVADPMRYGLANNYVNVADFLLKSFL
ncbi:MAG TPA: Asd/ArgC dimerization domain-containing protein [Gammaproteobacteria bacterium]|nr:Asd/ArgC dimerization domain-containing protein [Gammaproteobacteria bacterium]